MYKKDGSRGLYTTSNGDIIHSDLNGTADIGQKGAVRIRRGVTPGFTKCIVIVHSDLLRRKVLREKQETRNASKSAGKAKQRRSLAAAAGNDDQSLLIRRCKTK